ncbi:hypothetical protein Lfu02_15040 [Longispora fulva]|uniref:site-specific DNA-methyltransferase (adenine-specific) n=1 Tax=Longispora fulva TaxID=619741 RepID=A0A8J7GLK8_9ACTN|nr:N-6 DNA methylase [Longispora fulva]MBG6140486.1 hypothetical protein [Longispora fulva]GIG57132.1 hypothetical protein Lfu02_15040 [Longispora fulva]
MSTSRRRPIGNPRDHAQRIAEAVAETWGRSASGGSDLEIPVGVVAALALGCQRLDSDGPAPTDLLLAATREDFIQVLRDLWIMFAVTRPDLSPNIGIARNWLFEDRSAHQLGAAHDVGRAALRAGLLDLLTDPEHRRGVDLLGPLLMTMRPASAISGRGQFYTPPEVSQVMANMLGVQPGTTVNEPSAGTGGMLCAAALHLRANGHDPATVTWYANDIDPLAVAALAINAHLWDLGPRVLFATANTLSEPDWIPRALAARDAALFEIKAVRMMATLRHLTTPTDDSPEQIAA